MQVLIQQIWYEALSSAFLIRSQAVLMLPIHGPPFDLQGIVGLVTNT